MSQLLPVTETIKKLSEPFNQINSYGLDFKQECLFARQHLEKSSYTLEAAQNNPKALQSAILNVAAIGISLNPALAHAYLVPRSPAKGKAPQICLDISYRGLVKLATDSGAIEWAKAVLVYEGDKFVWRGPAEMPMHEADVFATDRIDAADPLKNLKGGYCIAKLQSGEVMVDVMTAGEILEVRNSSMAKAGPWQGKWAGEMAKKTLVKRASKSWPQSSERERVDTAIQILNQHEGIEEAAHVDEEKVQTFLNLVAAGDPLPLLNFTRSLTDEEATACFNTAPKGEKTKLKDRVRGLEREAHNILDDYAHQITEACESGDPEAVSLYGELTDLEREMVDSRLSDITHRQLQQITQEAAA